MLLMGRLIHDLPFCWRFPTRRFQKLRVLSHRHFVLVYVVGIEGDLMHGLFLHSLVAAHRKFPRRHQHHWRPVFACDLLLLPPRATRQRQRHETDEHEYNRAILFPVPYHALSSLYDRADPGDCM
jgi:hypothetical protein